MRELVRTTLRTKVRVELGSEDERVDDVRAARVVSDEQRRAAAGDIVQAVNLSAEVITESRAPQRQHAADVVRIPRVELVSVKRPPRMNQIVHGHLAPGNRPIKSGTRGAEYRSVQLHHPSHF